MKNRIVLFLLLLMAIIAGITVFATSAYRPATINIDATSLQQGSGTVSIPGRSPGGQVSRDFAITNYTGEKKLYVIEMPAVEVQSVWIRTQVPNGLLGIDRIILSNDSISYSFDEQGGCLQQGTSNPRKQEPCVAGSPALVTSEDASLVITGIPATGFVAASTERIVKALFAALLTLLSGIWLFRPLNNSSEGLLHQCTVRGSWLAVALLCLHQFLHVCAYAVDVPIQDEWMYFRRDGLIQGLSLQWLFKFQNEHPFAITKLMSWVNLQLFGLNFAIQLIINYFIFTGVLAIIFKLKNGITGKNSFELFPLFLVYLLSSLNVENHLWAIQSQYHLVLLLSTLMLCQAFGGEVSYRRGLRVSICAVLAIFTYSAGFIIIGIYLACISIFFISGIVGRRFEKTKAGGYILMLWGICGTGLVLWFLGYKNTGMPQPRTSPMGLPFWDFFFNVVSFGFGFERMNIFIGMVCLAVAVLPLLLLLLDRKQRWSASTWMLLSAVLAILAVIASISLGRAWIYLPKTSRYFEFASLLIPYSALGWWLVMKNNFRRWIVLSCLWICCFLAFFDDWTTARYAEFRQSDLYDLQHVKEYYSGADKEFSPEMSTPADLERAKLLGASFTRQFTVNPDESRPPAVTGKLPPP